MPQSSPRDTFAFPLAAALWAVAGSFAASLVNTGITLGRYMGDSAMPDVLRDLLPGLVGQSLLGAALMAVLVFVVATRRQRRAPERIGHGHGAAAATGLLAAFGAWVAVSLVSALAYSFIPALQSPIGFAVVGVAMSLLHVAVAALGASVGAALVLKPGTTPMPATPSRHAWAGAAIFGTVLAFGIDLVSGALPGLLHDTLGSGMFATAQWSPLLALLVGANVALGYAWRRRRAETTLAWSGDAWAALAVLPITLVLGAGIGVLGVALAYLMGDGGLPALMLAGTVVLLLAGIAFGALGALAGLLRTRREARPR
ncbi:hypothetical protein [Silanimonas sp.]|jgi:hypothetical protein|uniref:hypothetical protein n=1 Tax=Silanimonas sp. TaxID=1929290 RepID=UPI0022BE9F41|nr:hypothetical protein [Silanimonas sp.]MCZ8062502.1 hypothetical protein [Silanimonas sp.]